ncbi:MAG: RNase adapter RapZ [Bacteroidales bacterium]|nr:RNase adapter RapZ [Bacteroidales bacterium]
MDIQILQELFRKWSGRKPSAMEPIHGSGSARKYFRLQNGDLSAIGVCHDGYEENRAFLSFTRHFRSHGLPVPEIYAEDLKQNAYLLSDLGDISLFSLLEKNRGNEIFSSAKIEGIFRHVLDCLIRFQVVAGRDLDYSYCYTGEVFNTQSMRWDLEYFKYYFLKPSGLLFHDQKLEEDFDALTAFLAQAGSNYFMYRDFQSRNILMVKNNPYFIDYQGGRKGPLQYDLASLLFQAKAGLPEEFRDRLRDYYLDKLSAFVNFDRNEFIRYFHGFVLLRMIQVLGAYGYRGLFEGKAHFIQSIPHAVANIRWFLDNVSMPVKIPELEESLRHIVATRTYTSPVTLQDRLTVSIFSFSYKNSHPMDLSGNGGGYVFDCRSLPNPGKEAKYRYLSGKDLAVRVFMEEHEETGKFLEAVFQLIDNHIAQYTERKFSHLMVSFGCTGGQHRSVYCAEKLANHIRGKFSVPVELIHTGQSNWIAEPQL